MKAEGCVKGKPVSLTVLDLGLFRVHAGPRDVGIQGYLIRTDAGEEILVDSGFPPKYAEDATHATEEDKLGSFGRVLSLTADNLADAQLRKAGSALDRITLMIQTHTHIDHVGFMDACPDAPIVIGAAERALPKPLYHGEVQPLDWPDRTWAEVDRDTALGPGLTVLYCPGHAPGELALLLDLPETGPVILTSDAMSRPGELSEGYAGAWDPGLACHHGARLIMLAAQTDAWMLYGHCPEQWPTLRKAPESYR